jgi:uncharacterized protein YndB with AHSA1/START domain
MTSLATERSIWISSTRERVWDALTNPEQLALWFVPTLPGVVLQRDDSNKITAHMGPMGIDFVTLDVIDPLNCVSMRSLPDQVITITYALSDQKDGTQVMVTASGFERLSPEAREERIQLCASGWEKALKNLKSHIDGDALPFPQAYTGPLFGYWRLPQEKVGIERSIWIKASCERVWQAVVDPKQIQQWFSPNTAWELTALQVGGRFFIPNPETHAEQYVEVIELLDPPYQLVTRCVPEAPDTVVKYKTYMLQEENGGTRLTLTYTGYTPEPEETRWNHMEENSVGFGMMLQNVKAFIEGEGLPFPYGF